MVKRLSERTIKTEDVQGEGSWIRVRSLTVGEQLGLQREAEIRRRWTYKLGRFVEFVRRWFRRESRVDRAEDTHLKTIKNVSAWNWKDGDGNDLPQPQEKPRVVFDLTEQELTTIYGAVYEWEPSEESKN